MKPIQGSICLYALVALLAGCSKPPGCADPETVAVTRSLLADKVLKSAADDPWAEGDAMRANDPEGLLAKFIEGVTVNLNAVTTSGYDAKSKRHMCEGTLLVAAEGESLSIPVEYSTQATENGKGDFLLRMSQTGLIVPGLRGKAWRYWQSRRYAGDWTGSYACDALDASATGPAGVFSVQVTATIDASSRLRLERVTRGGGTETLVGSVDEAGVAKMQGEGANSPDDRWKVVFAGKIDGKVLSASGAISPEEGAGRSCKLTLERTSSGAPRKGGASTSSSSRFPKVRDA